MKMTEDPRVVYVSHCSGAFDLMVITREKIDFSMESGFENFVLTGPRSDFMYNKVERKSMIEYYTEFQDFLNKGEFIKLELTFPVREDISSLKGVYYERHRKCAKILNFRNYWYRNPERAFV
jgi:hypothetical protein